MKSMKISIFVLGIGLLLSGCAPVQSTTREIEKIQISSEEIERIQAAAAKVLPEEANVEVTLESGLLTEPTLIISAHLLEGHSHDEESPYVRGDYETHEKLVRLVRYRSAKILKSVINEDLPPDVKRIKIQARHGVRVYHGPVLPHIRGKDTSMIIYMINVSIDDMKSIDRLRITEGAIMQLWGVEKNIIPRLKFQRTQILFPR